MTIEGSQPAASTTVTTATFSFRAEQSDSGEVTFECRLDEGLFSPCTSPQTYSSLAPGAHSSEVRAVDAVGNVGSPSGYRWTVEAPAAPPPPASTSKVLTPVNGERIAVIPEEGTILIRRPGHKKATPLKEGQTKAKKKN